MNIRQINLVMYEKAMAVLHATIQQRGLDFAMGPYLKFIQLYLHDDVSKHDEQKLSYKY